MMFDSAIPPVRSDSVHGIVEQSGGHIHIRSEIGKGTTFEIHFPKSNRRAERPGEQVTACQKGGETILFVEDEPELRHILK